jgi:hypothetical protein
VTPEKLFSRPLRGFFYNLVGLRVAPAWVECDECDRDDRRRYANDAHRKRGSPARNPTGRS